MGVSETIEGVPLSNLDGNQDGCICNNVAGSYIHGIFDNMKVAGAIVKILADYKGVQLEETEEFDFAKYKEQQYDILADSFRKSVDMDEIYRILGV